MKLMSYMVAAVALAGCATAGRPRAEAPVAQGTQATIAPGEIAVCDREVVEWPLVRKEVRVSPPRDTPMGRNRVRMSMVISTTGTVSGIQIVESAGQPFDDLAKTAMAQFVFSPARARDEQPVACRITYRYVFMGCRPGHCT